MSISSIPSSSDVGSSSQQTSLPTIPNVSFTSIGNISELLRDLVFVRPIDKTLLDFDVDENEPEIDSTFGLEKLNLFDNKSNFDRSLQLLNSNEPNLVDSITKLLLQTDTSKLNLKPEYENSNKKSIHFSALLQTLVSNEPNLFNGELNTKLKEHQIQNSPKVEIINSPSNRLEHKKEPVASKNDPIQPPQSTPINNLPTRSESQSYKIVSDPNKLCVKLTRIDSPKKKEELKDTIKTSSFYSTTKTNANQINSPKLGKKSERIDTKSNIALPDGFTPELIQQLAAEGYDVTGSAGRKSRNLKYQTESISTSAKKLLDSSSDDSDTNNDDNYKFKSKKDSKLSNTPSKNQIGARVNNNIIKKKVDLSDPLEHPSYKRFTQILDDLLDSYEQDLQQMSLNKNKESEEKQGEIRKEEQDDEIPSEYLLSRQVCADLVQEAFKLHTYSIMNLIKKENLFKLQNLLFYNIKDVNIFDGEVYIQLRNGLLMKSRKKKRKKFKVSQNSGNGSRLTFFLN
ncbi:unnamed protein product [Brachionus calyciflorus]|uniref:Uncharacterized protein n=1 Tax=Brachionus calyciflorus TaxID=104777 RepID=A0A813TTL6_9BILA|nr:unnamed protein product [Brachionus calyciflorus]